MSDTSSFAVAADGLLPGVTGSPTPEQIRANQSAFHQAAQAVTGQQPPAQPQQNVLTQEVLIAAVEAARKEEKDKLYPQLDEMRNELAEIKAERERVAKEAADAKAAADEAERQAREKEMNGKQLAEAVRSELTERLNALEAERDQERAIFDRERQFSALQQYRDQQLAVHGQDIIPNLHQFVQGGTPEEIDQSIATLKNSSAEIFQAAAAQQQQAFSAMRGVAPTGMPPAAGPVDNESFERQFTPEQISKMSDAEYARYRPQLLNWTSRQHRGQGR